MSMIGKLAEDVKVGVGVATGTTGFGIGTIAEWIPSDIGKIATLIGIILSSVLIYVNLKRHFREEKLARLDMELKLKQLGQKD